MQTSYMNLVGRLSVIFAALVFAVQLNVRAQEADTQPAEKGKDLVSALESQENYTWLVDALKRTGLAKSLKAEGTFTLFAPTDEAVAKLPEGRLEAMSDEELTDVLRYHMLVEEVSLEKAEELGTLMTVQGASLTVTEGDDGFEINGAAVAKASMEARNGLIHGINTVLIPPADNEGESGS